MSRPPQSAENYGYTISQGGVISVEQSAKVVVPLICKSFHPSSVLDVGCGVGDWLKVFLENGAATVFGCDGPWVPLSGLQIPTDCFRSVDFYAELPEVGRFDLATCLEVVEHVSPDVAARMVGMLCKSADLILFSAAVPGQGGYEHINEKFQAYWIAEFESHGFLPYDLVRPRIWMDERVSWWYQQNCLVFANSAAKQKHELKDVPIITSVVHPFLYARERDPENYSAKKFIKHFPAYVRRALKKRFRS